MAEANILSRHASNFPFIPDIYDVWTDAGQTYIAMEYIAGPTLDQLLDPPWSPAQVMAFLRTLLDYLAQIHEAGIIHHGYGLIYLLSLHTK